MKKYIYSFLGFTLGITVVLTLKLQIPEPVIATVSSYENQEINYENDHFKIDNIEKFVGYKVTSEELQDLIKKKIVTYGRTNPMKHTLISMTEDKNEDKKGSSNNSNNTPKPGNSNFVLLHNNQYDEMQNGVIKGYNKVTTEIEDVNVSSFINNYKGNIIHPLKDNFMKVTSRFGVREPIKELGGTEYEFHTGTDYSNTNILGEPIKSISSGKVKKIQESNTGYGNLVIIESDDISIYYAHLRSIDSSLTEGMNVETGQILGEVGNTGRSTGPHLHLEINIGDVAINPELFFKLTNINNEDTPLTNEDSDDNKLIDQEYLDNNKIKPLKTRG